FHTSLSAQATTSSHATCLSLAGWPPLHGSRLSFAFGRTSFFGSSSWRPAWLRPFCLVPTPLTQYGRPLFQGPNPAPAMKRALLTSLLLVVAAAIAATPWIFRHTTRFCAYPASSTCINNLRSLDGAKLVWALEEHKGTNDVPTMAQVARFLHPVPTCPS